MQLAFGSGVIYGVQQTTAAGAAVANATPQRFGILQDISLDVSFTNKMLKGQYQFPVAVGRGEGKVQGKAKFAQLNGSLVNGLFFGQTLTVGQDLISDSESLTITTNSGAAANGATYREDLGVTYKATGLPLTKVAATPTTGQYSVTGAGVYTFAAGDVGAATGNILVSYRYSGVTTGTTANQLIVSNALMGYAPTFTADLYFPYNGKMLVCHVHSAIGSKLNFATKIDDFMIPEFDFDCFADASSNVLTLNFAE